MSEHTLTIEARPEETRSPSEDEVWFGEPDRIIVTAGGWYTECACGWQANNPHATEADAALAAAYHEQHAAIEDARAAAIAAFHAADNDGDRATAAAAYNEPGAKR